MILNRKLRLALLVIVVLIQFGLYGSWIINKEESIYETSRKVATIIEKEAVIAGGWAPVLGMENRLKTLYFSFSEGVNLYNLDKLKPDYIVIHNDPLQYDKLKEIYPNEMRAAITIDTFEVAIHELLLIKLQWPD